MEATRWGNAEGLTWEQIQEEGGEQTGEWGAAKEAYRNLKNYFHNQGQYDDERQAYYREKLMAKHEAFWEWFRGTQPFLEPIKDLWKRPFRHLWRKRKDFSCWFKLWFLHITTGFGDRVRFTVLWALGFVALFGFIYWGGSQLGWFQFDFKPKMIPGINFFTYIYLSVVTFATLGFGDITPLCWQAQIPVIIEVILGYVFLGLIVTIIARRFGR